MTTSELIEYLKGAPETAEVCIDGFGKKLLPITSPHAASPEEKTGAGLDRHLPIVVIPAKAGLGPVRASELVRHLKMLAGVEVAEVCFDDGGGGLLPLNGPLRMASEKERRERSPRPDELAVVIPAKTGLEA